MYDVCKNTRTPARPQPLSQSGKQTVPAKHYYSSGAFRSSSEQSLIATRKRNASMYDTSTYVCSGFLNEEDRSRAACHVPFESKVTCL